MTCKLKTTKRELTQQVAHMQRISSGIEPHIHTDRTRRQPRFESCGIGGVMDETTRSEFAE
jgi:hypothetical protein